MYFSNNSTYIFDKEKKKKKNSCDAPAVIQGFSAIGSQLVETNGAKKWLGAKKQLDAFVFMA